MQLILASQSPYRRAQLEQLGLSFTAIKPLCDEEALKEIGPDKPFELTRYLAYHKAESLRAQFPEALILGSDQIAEIDGERLDKPGTRERAIAQLARLQGRAHRLITSLVVLSPAQVQTFTDVTTLHLRKLKTDEIEAYVDLDQPFDCAGAYKIERAGYSLLRAIDTQDPSAVQGLPLLSLGLALNKSGFDWKATWRKS